MSEKTKEILDEITLHQSKIKEALSVIASIPTDQPGPWLIFYADDKMQYRKFVCMKHIEDPLLIVTNFDLKNGLSGETWSRLENRIQSLIEKGEICQKP